MARAGPRFQGPALRAYHGKEAVKPPPTRLLRAPGARYGEHSQSCTVAVGVYRLARHQPGGERGSRLSSLRLTPQGAKSR